MFRHAVAAVVLFAVLSAVPSIAQRSYRVFRTDIASSPHRMGTPGAFLTDPAVVRQVVTETRPSIALDVPLPGGTTPMVLRAHDVVSASSRLTIMGDGGPEHRSLRQDVVVYRGSTPNGTEVTLTLHRSGDIAGSVTSPSGRYVIGPDRSSMRSDRYLLAPETDRAYSCGTAPEARSPQIDRIVREAHRAAKAPDVVQSEDTLTIALAVEADHDLFKEFASSTAATTYITALVAAMSTTYERELGVKLSIANLRLWSTASDPYASDRNVFDLLDDFVNLYRSEMQGVDRDLAVFLTARGGMGGIARTIGGICEEDGSYCAGDLNLRMRDYPTWSWDVGMMAHEIGHVCGGIHTMSCYWPGGPLDSCVTSESGFCVSSEETRPTRGTIMSYCHQQVANGAVMTLEFHPMHRAVLRSFISSASCLGAAPPVRNVRLQGRVVDGVTGEPVANVPLTIRPVINDIYRQTPPVQGDTSTTSAADGTYSFTGLAMGLYSISVAAPYASYPIAFDEYTLPSTVMITTEMTTFDIRVVRGREVELTVDHGGDTMTTYVTLYGPAIPEIYVTAPVRPDAANGGVAKRSQVLPLGRYIVVASAYGRTFTPAKQIVDLVDGAEPLAVSFTSTASTIDSSITSSVGVADRSLRDGRPVYTLVGGMPYTVYNADMDEIATGTVPEDGVIVLENLPKDEYYMVSPQVDTTRKVPYAETAYLFPSYMSFAGSSIQRDRRQPLLARQFAFSVVEGTYRPLEAPTILRDRVMPTAAAARIDLPFALRMLDRTWSEAIVHRNGYVTFGGWPFPAWQTTPLASPEESEFIASPFASELWPDTLAPEPWHIAWSMDGTAPDRRLIVEWKNFMVRWYDWQQGRAEDIGRFSFQLHLSENGTVEFVYDDAANVSKAITAQVGLRGNDQLDNAMVALMDENRMASGRAFYTQNIQFVSFDLDRAMTRGLTYRWRPTTSSVDGGTADPVRGCSPLPATSSVRIHGFDGSLRVRVVDLMGATVYRSEMDGADARIDVRGLATGSYTVIVDSQGTSTALPLVISR